MRICETMNLHAGEQPLTPPKPTMAAKTPVAKTAPRVEQGNEKNAKSRYPKEQQDSANSERAQMLAEKLHEKLAEADPDDFGKAGRFVIKAEGSRGGNITGHTASGAPIYGGHNLGVAALATHPDMTQAQHKDAGDKHAKLADHHRRQGAMARTGGRHDEAKKHESLQASHSTQASAHHHAAAILQSKASKSMQKGGEGTRGGKILGHTKSGKPIYGASHPSYASVLSAKESSHNAGDQDIKKRRAVASAHKDYTPQDHADAAEVHLGRKDKASRTIGRAHSDQHESSTRYNDTEKSMNAADELRDFLCKAEGTRGGHIIGHTKSGKPIYGTNHAAYTQKEKPRGYNSEVSPASAHGRDGGKMLQRRMGDHSKQDHLDASEAHHAEADRLQAEHAKVSARAEKKAYGRKLGFGEGANISGGVDPKFSEKTNNKLRDLAHTASSHRNLGHAHEAASQYLRTSKTEKSMKSQAADELKDFLSKASGGLPTIETPSESDFYSSDVNGGPFNGPQTGSNTSRSEGYPKDAPKADETTQSKNNVKGRPNGDSKSDGYPKDAPNTPEVTDWHQVKQMNRNQLERSMTGTSLQATLDQAAHEAALERQAFRKSQRPEDVIAGRGIKAPPPPAQPEMRKSVEVSDGLVTYVNSGLDDMASDMIKSGHRFDGAQPTFALGQRSLLNQGVLCKSCDATHSAMYTACPSCGAGTTLSKAFVNAPPVQQGFVGAPRAAGRGLQPNIQGDVSYAQYLSQRGKE